MKRENDSIITPEDERQRNLAANLAIVERNKRIAIERQKAAANDHGLPVADTKPRKPLVLRAEPDPILKTLEQMERKKKVSGGDHRTDVKSKAANDDSLNENLQGDLF